MKYVFLAEEVIYLGYNITKDRILHLPDKVKAQDIKPPENTTQLKEYLGILNYFNHYLSNLSAIIEQLRLEKGQHFTGMLTRRKPLLFRKPSCITRIC